MIAGEGVEPNWTCYKLDWLMAVHMVEKEPAEGSVAHLTNRTSMWATRGLVIREENCKKFDMYYILRLSHA